ncbi:HAD-like protein [Hesseltinella vesiculosa]|uniref:HAD-like protein n=1 Tax=Hesseltinella vesiculosa TaxID=101127 RepID=A0A1X2GG22_9FUNG|nr:HAD-like protein [Hesseltinella vesiculosa]
MVQRVQQGEHRLRVCLGLDVLVDTLKVHKRHRDQQRYFEFRSTRYVDRHHTGTFQAATIDLGTRIPTLLDMRHGLNSSDALARLDDVGHNFISVQVPRFIFALWQELTGFFYIYQLQILWVYFYLAYWQIGVSDTGVIMLSAIIKVVVRLRSEYRVKSMAEHVEQVQVLRDAQWITESTANLVPGDVFALSSHQVVPVDGVLLLGDVVPLPIRKVPLRDDGHAYDLKAAGKIHTLFSGTTVKQASQGAMGLVMTTRTNTEKGQLVKKILFPQPVSFIFHEQLKLVFCILMLWAVFLLGVGSWWLGGTGMTALFYGLCCAAQVINPLLPAMLVVGQSIASGRLLKLGVYCVDLSRILMAGKVQVFCFDKTGTLTKEGLEFYGVYATCHTEQGAVAFSSLRPTMADLTRSGHRDNNSTSGNIDNDHLLLYGLATCHGVTQLGESGELVGNPVDLVMFQSTRAKLSVNDDGYDVIHLPDLDDSLEIIHRFEFQHARASMSVAVRDRHGHVHVFCKGSFEQIRRMVLGSNHNSPGSALPGDFDHVTANLAREGSYVLAMAYRNLGPIDATLVQSWTRDELEAQMSFLGLVLFKNFLKDDTKDAICQLKKGDTRTVMITGDNALTGVFIGRQAALVPPNVRVLVGDLANKDAPDGPHPDDNFDSDGEQKQLTLSTSKTVVWTDADTDEVFTQEQVEWMLLASDGKPLGLEPISKQPVSSQAIELAVTGPAFGALVEQGRMRPLLFSTRIFARMTPVDKMVCVELIMERAVTAMCGDGGNDCGALRTAHVGMAMSEAEASVVSPFSTPRRSVQACVDLLIQGRAGLATSFASYKYFTMYSQTMVTVKFFTFYYTMSFSQWNFILIDAFITILCSFAVTQSQAAKRLSTHRPTARILGAEVLLSVVGQIFINAWFLVGAYIWLYTRDDFFRCREWDSRATDPSKWWLLGDSFEADILTFITLYQFVNAGFLFNYGYLFRQSWYRNYLLLAIWTLFTTIVSYWELADPNPFGCLVRLNCGNPDVLVSMGYPRPTFAIEPYNTPWGNNVLPRPFRYQLWAYAMVNFLVANLWERGIILGPPRAFCRKKFATQRLQVTL